MARITWTNVEAPNASGAAQSMALASDMLGKGFDALGGTFGKARESFVDRRSAEALAAAAQINDPDALNQALATQGFAGTFGGVNPADIDPETMKMLMGYRDTLIGNENTRAETAKTQAGTQDILAGIPIKQDENSRENAQESRTASNYAFDRPRYEKGVITAEEIAAEQQAGAAFAEQLGNDPMLNDPEVVKRMIMNEPTLSPAAREAALGAYEKLIGQGELEVPSAVKEMVSESFPVFGEAKVSLSTNEQLLSANNVDPELAFWTNAKTKFSEDSEKGSALVQVLDFYKDLAGRQTNGNESAVSATANSIQAIYKDLEGQFPGMDPEVIAYAIQQSIGDGSSLISWNADSSSFRFWDTSRVDVATKEAFARLASIDSPEKRADLEGKSQRLREISDKRSKLSEKMSKLENEIGSLVARGAPQEEIDKVLSEVEKTNKDIQIFLRDYPAVPEKLDGEKADSPGGANERLGATGSGEEKEITESWRGMGMNTRPGLKAVPQAVPSEFEAEVLRQLRDSTQQDFLGETDRLIPIPPPSPYGDGSYIGPPITDRRRLTSREWNSALGER